MSIIFIDPDPNLTSGTARRLADDLDRLKMTGHPSDADLATAPILNMWRMAVRPDRALIGFVDGHPSVVAGHTALTSGLYAIDTTAGWARTWSRFYLLGRPLDPIDGRQQ